MHVCHILLVQADTVEDAFESALSTLHDQQPEWSDWHNANNPVDLNWAGRWTGAFFKSDKEDEPNPNYLCYAEDKALAENVISDQLELRDREIANLRKHMISDLTTVEANHYADKWNSDLWYTEKFCKLLSNDWTPDSYIYDLETHTGSLEPFMKRVLFAPEKQWLIPLDLHF